MSKSLKVFTATALAVTAVAPIASAAEDVKVVQDGVYAGEGFFTLTAFQALDMDEKIDLILSDDSVVVMGGKAYTLLDVITFEGEDTEEIAKTIEEYEADSGVVLEDGKGFEGVEPPVVGEVKVESVSAINATQVQVTFNKAVDKDSVIEATGGNAGTLFDGVFDFRTLDNKTITADSAKGSLSEDGKTLTITAQINELFEGRYDVTIDGAKDKDGNAVEKYEVKNLDLGKDTTAPTIVGTEQVSANQVKVKFSEPVKGGTITAKYADGTAITGFVAPTLAATGVDEAIFNLSDDDIKVNKDIVVTFNGVQDMAGNLISPQPATATIVKLPVDGVEPTVSTITQTGAKKFTIKFNKDLDGNLVAADVTVGGTATTGTVKKISASEYEFTTVDNLKGLQTVTVEAGKAKDLAGQTNTDALSQVVSFTEDTVAPKAIAQLTTDKNNKQVIELTFDKDVTAGDVSVAGKQVKDYVTTTGISETVTAVYADANNKKVLHIPLSATALKEENAAYDLTISSTAVKSDTGEEMDDVKVQFTRGKDGQPENVNTDIVTGVNVAQDVSDNNKVNVTFTIPSGSSLDGATATNIANYVIAGAEVESVTLAAASGTTQVATLKLKEDSNTFTGTRNITVKNVKVAGSTKVMDPVTINNVSLDENVRPTITKSEVTDITLGSDLIPSVSAVDATVSNPVLVAGSSSSVSGSPVVTLDSLAYNSGSTDKAAVTGVELEYDGSVWKSNTSGVADSDIASVTGLTDLATGDKVTFDLSAYKAEVAEVPAVSASSEVTLTFSEAVTKSGAAVDFELFVGGEKSTATVATTTDSNTTTLKVKINKALTAEDFSKGVELKAVSTLDIKDQVGNLLKVDGRISLQLN